VDPSRQVRLGDAPRTAVELELGDAHAVGVLGLEHRRRVGVVGGRREQRDRGVECFVVDGQQAAITRDREERHPIVALPELVRLLLGRVRAVELEGRAIRAHRIAPRDEDLHRVALGHDHLVRLAGGHGGEAEGR
jgi:hypothetical protein